MTEKREETVVDLLLRQHEQIRRLFSRVAEGAGKAREEAFEELRYLLVVHETAEEEIVHPFARQAIGSGARLTESRLEEAKEALQELDRIGTDSVEFEPLFSRLHNAVAAHAESEERLEFPGIASRSTPQQLKGMVAAVRVAEAFTPIHPYPGIESPAGHVVLGPMSAVIDRTRDAIRHAMG